MRTSALVSTQNHVEVPFIIVTIGKYKFGHFDKKTKGSTFEVTYPNYMESLNITKINGAEIEPVDCITAGSPCQD